MKRFFYRFKQFGGVELVKEYYRMGVLGTAVKMLISIVLCHKSIGQADAALRFVVAPKLRSRFFPVMKQLEKKYENVELLNERSNKVWFCWMQGLNQAPEVVKVCFQSLQRHLRDKEIVVITNENISRYVTLPDFINEKYRKGIIPQAHYADILRLELLINHGGTWIDATVFCSNDNYAKEVLDCDLFVYQQLKKGYAGFIGLSNWFITSCTNNKLLMILRDMLYEYWREYNCVVDYFVFHLFFGMIARYHQEEMDRMPKHSNQWPLMLAERLADDYDDSWFNELSQHTSFHKLSYRVKKGIEREESFYHVLIQNYGM